MADVSQIGTLLNETGRGLGAFMDAITMPLAILAIVGAIAVGIGFLMKHTLGGIGRKLHS